MAALLQDLLISVTNFFRDADCFAALGRAPAARCSRARAGDAVRVWVCRLRHRRGGLFVGDAPGRARRAAARRRCRCSPPTWTTRRSQAARDGGYPTAIEADVSEERLRRFFIEEHHGYRVRRELREMVLFAVHDLLKDSPFSRLDLISCRNLLIYLNRDAQRACSRPSTSPCCRTACCSWAPRSRWRMRARCSRWSTRSTASTRSARRPRAVRVPGRRPVILGGRPGGPAFGTEARFDRAVAFQRTVAPRPSRARGAPRPGRAAPSTAGAAGAALGAGRRRVRHRPPVAQRRALPAVRGGEPTSRTCCGPCTRACASSCARPCTRRATGAAEVAASAGGSMAEGRHRPRSRVVPVPDLARLFLVVPFDEQSGRGGRRQAARRESDPWPATSSASWSA